MVKSKTPARYVCSVCGRPCNPKSKSTARQVVGWVTPRQAGGANHIRYQRNTGHYAHRACLSETEEPAKELQGELFK